VRTTKVEDQRDYVKVLFYGMSKVGKTTALASLANLGRVLYIDAEAGLKRLPLEQLEIDTKNIEVLDFSERYKAIDEAFWELKQDLEEDAESWAGVVWDSGTEIYQAFLDQIVETRVQRARTAVPQRNRSVIPSNMQDPFFIDRDDYGEAIKKVRTLMRHYRDLPCHFGTAFLERRDQDDKTRMVTIGPSIAPSLQGEMVGWHDVVGHSFYDASKDLYLAAFRQEGVAVGGDRFHVLPPLMVNPSFERIIDYVQGTLTIENDEEQKQLNPPVQQERGDRHSVSAGRRAHATT